MGDLKTKIWPNQDPIAEEGGLNLYDCCYNDPLNWIDPYGLDIWIEGPNSNEPILHQSITSEIQTGIIIHKAMGRTEIGYKGRSILIQNTGDK